MDRLSKDDEGFQERVRRASREAAAGEDDANEKAAADEEAYEAEQEAKRTKRPSLSDLRRLSASGEGLSAISSNLKKLSASGEFDAKSTLKAAGGAVRLLGRGASGFSRAAADKLQNQLAEQAAGIAAALDGAEAEGGGRGSRSSFVSGFRRASASMRRSGGD